MPDHWSFCSKLAAAVAACFSIYVRAHRPGSKDDQPMVETWKTSEVGAHDPGSEDQPMTVIGVHNKWFEALPATGLASMGDPTLPSSASQPILPSSALQISLSSPPAEVAADASKTAKEDKAAHTWTKENSGPAGGAGAWNFNKRLSAAAMQKAQSDDDSPYVHTRDWDTGGPISFQGHGLPFNSLKLAQSNDPMDQLIGEVIATLLIGFTVFMAMILYFVNYPDPQVASYGKKLVSTGMSICCAVMTEKVLFQNIKPLIPNPVAKDDASISYLASDVFVRFVFFIISFTLISWFAHRSRASAEDLYAVKAFVAHVSAFLAIHTFGHLEKKTCKKYESFDGAFLCYAWFPVCTMLVLHICGIGAAAFRKRLDPKLDMPTVVDGETAAVAAPSNAPSDWAVGSVEVHEDHGHHWVHTALEGESDCKAIVVSFLLRQLVLIQSTGRLPGTQGDGGHHGSAEWHWLGGCIGLNFLVMVLATCGKHVMGWQGQEGPLSEGMTMSQLVLSMTLGWNGLTVCHWLMQSVVSSSAAWNIGTAFAVSPLAFVIIVIVDKLADKDIIGPRSEPLFLNSAGLILGFAWEVAFGSAIDNSVTLLKTWPGKWLSASAITCFYQGLACTLVVAVLLPSWRLHLVPSAAKEVPPRKQMSK